jgi:hypothetical protein
MIVNGAFTGKAKIETGLAGTPLLLGFLPTLRDPQCVVALLQQRCQEDLRRKR